MVKYLKYNDLEIINRIKDNFVEDGAYTRNVCAAQIKKIFLDNPDNVCVLVGEDDKKGIIGHIVAWKFRDYVWLDQAWHCDSEFHYADVGFRIFEQWCRDSGTKEIRMETNRNIDVWRRRFGFVLHSSIMKKELK